MQREVSIVEALNTPWPESDEVAQKCIELLAGHQIGRLLDAGGGRGLLAARLGRTYRNCCITVLDPDGSALAAVPQQYDTKRCRIEDLGLADGFYSTILLRQVLHYVAEPIGVLTTLLNRLAATGVMYVGQIVAPDAECGRWLGRHAEFVSAERRRIWTADELTGALVCAGLVARRVIVSPHWQPLERVRGRAPHADRPLHAMPVIRVNDTDVCRVFWFHAVVTSGWERPKGRIRELQSGNIKSIEPLPT